jgi:hypothetical protein
MFSFILAFFVFALGAKALSEEGIPLDRTRSLKGTKGKICGVLCILFGLLLVADGIFSIVRMTQ